VEPLCTKPHNPFAHAQDDLREKTKRALLSGARGACLEHVLAIKLLLVQYGRARTHWTAVLRFVSTLRLLLSFEMDSSVAC